VIPVGDGCGAFADYGVNAPAIRVYEAIGMRRVSTYRSIIL